MYEKIENQFDSYLIKKEGNKFEICFKNSLNKSEKIKVTEEVYLTFEEYRLKDKSQRNKYDRHLEHSEIYENNLESRRMEKSVSLEDDFIQKMTFAKLKKAIEMLPVIQKRRIKKYYFEDKTQAKIAEEEDVDIRAVQYTLKKALKNLRKFLIEAS